MRQNRFVIAVGALLVLCICTLVICASVYLSLGRTREIAGPAASLTSTTLPLPPAATNVPATPGGGESMAPPTPVAPAPSGPRSGTSQGQVSVATDRAVYEPGDSVNISLTNQLDVPIWYARRVDCGLSFWRLKRCDLVTEIQYAVACAWAEPQYLFTRLDPGETASRVWPGMIQELGDSGLVELPLETGCYRLSVPYALSEPRAQTWGQGEFVEVFSPEFSLGWKPQDAIDTRRPVHSPGAD